MNKKTAITIVITVVLAEISKMLMNTTKCEVGDMFSYEENRDYAEEPVEKSK